MPEPRGRIHNELGWGRGQGHVGMARICDFFFLSTICAIKMTPRVTLSNQTLENQRFY